MSRRELRRERERGGGGGEGERGEEERERRRRKVGGRLTGSEARLLLSMLSSLRWTHSHMEAGISVSLLYLHNTHTITHTISPSLSLSLLQTHHTQRSPKPHPLESSEVPQCVWQCLKVIVLQLQKHNLTTVADL